MQTVVVEEIVGDSGSCLWAVLDLGMHVNAQIVPVEQKPCSQQVSPQLDLLSRQRVGTSGMGGGMLDEHKMMQRRGPVGGRRCR